MKVLLGLALLWLCIKAASALPLWLLLLLLFF
jgi:hypothetical protein